MINKTELNNSHNYVSEDEIDVRQLIKILWDGKVIITAIAVVFSTIAVIYSLSLPNIYQSKALLSPVVDQGNSNQVSSSIGGLASLAGLNLSSQSGGNSAKAIKKLRTLSFFEENILPNIFLPDLMAIESWDSYSNSIIYNENSFNQNTKTWSEIPSSQKSYRVFMDLLEFSEDTTTGFITISVKHQSPYIAKKWTELVVNEINNFFRAKDKREAQAAMDFLNIQISQTSFTEIKQVIAQLLQHKMQTLTLIEANEFYVFSYLDPPMVMEDKIEPSRSSISILGAVLGFMLGVLIVIIRHYLSNRNNI